MLNNYWQEAISIGIITSIIGMFSLFFIKKYEEIDHNEAVTPLLKKRYWLNWKNVILCFILGVSIHMIIEFIGLNQWYCSKKCAADTCVYVCQKPVGINFFGERTKILPIPNTSSS